MISNLNNSLIEADHINYNHYYIGFIVAISIALFFSLFLSFYCFFYLKENVKDIDMIENGDFDNRKTSNIFSALQNSQFKFFNQLKKCNKNKDFMLSLLNLIE